MAQSSTSQYEKILQTLGVNTRKYWLVEVIENDCIVTWVGVYDEILPQPSGNPLGTALRISLGLRQYFIVYPYSSQNTVTVYTGHFTVYTYIFTSQTIQKVIHTTLSYHWCKCLSYYLNITNNLNLLLDHYNSIFNRAKVKKKCHYCIVLLVKHFALNVSKFLQNCIKVKN